MIKYTKFQTAILLLFVFVFSIFYGRARKKVSNPKRVLAIYLTKNIGDMIFATPVFRALKEEYPDCVLSVIGSPKNEDMLAYNPDVDKYIVCPKSIFALWKIIKKQRAEYAFLFTTSSTELSLLYLAGIRSIGMFSIQNASGHTRSYSILKRLGIEIPFYSGKNFAVQNLTLLSPIGIHSENVRKHLFYSKEGEEGMLNFIKQKDVNVGQDLLVGMAPGAGTKIKQWPAIKFAKLADHISAKYNTPIFIVGGPSDKVEFDEMQSAVSNSTKLISCLDQSIDELKAFVSKLDIIIANDSAPIYIGEAFNKATIVIVGPTDENEHPPTGKYHRTVVWDKKGKSALPSMASVDIDEKVARMQIESITVEQVVETTDELISTLEKK